MCGVCRRYSIWKRTSAGSGLAVPDATAAISGYIGLMVMVTFFPPKARLKPIERTAAMKGSPPNWGGYVIAVLG